MCNYPVAGVSRLRSALVDKDNDASDGRKVAHRPDPCFIVQDAGGKHLIGIV